MGQLLSTWFTWLVGGGEEGQDEVDHKYEQLKVEHISYSFPDHSHADGVPGNETITHQLLL